VSHESGGPSLEDELAHYFINIMVCIVLREHGAKIQTDGSLGAIVSKKKPSLVGAAKRTVSYCVIDRRRFGGLIQGLLETEKEGDGIDIESMTQDRLELKIKAPAPRNLSYQNQAGGTAARMLLGDGGVPGW
jgi:hypothetical protein